MVNFINDSIEKVVHNILFPSPIVIFWAVLFVISKVILAIKKNK